MSQYVCVLVSLCSYALLRCASETIMSSTPPRHPFTKGYAVVVCRGQWGSLCVTRHSQPIGFGAANTKSNCQKHRCTGTAESQMHKHFQALRDSFGQSTCNDLKELKQEKLAANLHAAVAACTQQQYSATLVPALAVVETTWKAHTETGWDHPAWREAYSLAQLCLAASYTFPEPHAALPAPRSSNIAQHPVNSTPPHQQPCHQGAQNDALPEPARLNPHRQEQGSVPQGSSSIGSIGMGSVQGDSPIHGSPKQGRPKQHSQIQQGRPSNGSHEQGSSEQGCRSWGSSKQGSYSLEAMQALDLASIMGAPAEMLAPLLILVEPTAKQAHQASLAQHHNHDLHPAQANPLSQQQSDSTQQNQQASPQHQQDNSDWRASSATQNASEERFRSCCVPSEWPEDMPHLDPDKTVARRKACELTAAEFKRLYWKTDTPVIVTGAMEGWKALHSWPSLPWWSQQHGHRTVPVELGTDSTHTWRETTMLLHSFMKDYMQPSVESRPHAEVAYIAQHPLFDQMPSLLSDFDQPELMGGTAVQMNAWIGTQGTVTPLHFDSYDNFLAQVAGVKFVRLYSRQQSHLLYVDGAEASPSAMHATRAQRNISAVNVEHPDLEKHPNFVRAHHLECVLRPGEMLFIPAKHWHYVRSLSPAVSLNFWY